MSLDLEEEPQHVSIPLHGMASWARPGQDRVPPKYSHVAGVSLIAGGDLGLW